MNWSCWTGGLPLYAEECTRDKECGTFEKLPVLYHLGHQWRVEGHVDPLLGEETGSVRRSTEVGLLRAKSLCCKQAVVSCYGIWGGEW